MKVLLILLIAFFSFKSFGDEPRHMVSFGSNGLGWSGAKEEIETTHRSAFKSVDHFLDQLAINYAVRLFSHLQLGAFYQNSVSEYEFQKRGNGQSQSKLKNTEFGFFVLYNFSKKLSQSFYLGAALSFFNVEEENSHDFTEAEGKAPFELDDEGRTYEILFGKRFSLEGIGIKNITYAPQVSAYLRRHGKDFADQKARNGRGIALQILKFDLLF